MLCLWPHSDSGRSASSRPLVVAHPSPSDGPLAGAGNALGDRPDIPHMPGLHEPDLLGADRPDQLRAQSCPRDVVA
eukprot:15052044-Alexandrium_andersonii.AAC.1